MSRYSYWGFKPQPTVWERQQKAAQTIARMRKKGANLSPVQLVGRTIARTFWGKAWCDNIESYRDFAYRLERGRSYVRSGAVIDLKISEGTVGALVIGSGRSPYEVVIRIDKMKKPDWDALVKRSSGKIASLMALAQGKLPKEMLEDFCNPETGLFPKPREIHFDCSCPFTESVRGSMRSRNCSSRYAESIRTPSCRRRLWMRSRTERQANWKAQISATCSG